jgi:hypothetical protein
MATQTREMAYRAARNAGMTEEKANKYADRVVADWNSAPSEFDSPARKAEKISALASRRYGR